MLPNFNLSEKNNFHLSSSLPTDWRGHILRGSTVITASSDRGTIVLQELSKPDYNIRYNVGNFQQPVKIAGRMNSSLMLSLLAIKNTIHWTMKGFRSLNVKQGQAALVHTLDTEITAHFDKDKLYQTLEVEWSSERVREIEPLFPFLRPLFETAKKDKLYFIRKPGFEAGYQVLDIAHDTLKNPYDNQFTDLFFGNKMREYLSLMMIAANKKKPPPYVVTDEERETILGIADMLSKEHDKHFPIEDLATLAGMNQMKLKTSFKHVTGQTIFQYHLHARMMEARRLLTESGYSIKQIAGMVNYKDAGNFQEAFLEYFDYPATSIYKK